VLLMPDIDAKSTVLDSHKPAMIRILRLGPIASVPMDNVNAAILLQYRS